MANAAAAMASSDTVIISSSKSERMGRVTEFGSKLTDNQSAKVGRLTTLVSVPLDTPEDTEA